MKTIEDRLQVLDVNVVDLLAHLEALLRHSHSIQRALRQLRSEAPPPRLAPAAAVMATMHAHRHDLRRECDSLCELIEDLATSIDGLTDVVPPRVR